MAVPGQVIENAFSGAVVEFLRTAGSTGGRLLEVVWTLPRPVDVPEHVHEGGLVERLEVLEGSGRMLVSGEMRRVSAGDRIEIPPGTPHWNPPSPDPGGPPLRVRQTDELPAPDMDAMLALEAIFETGFGLTREGRVDSRGLPKPLQLIVLARAMQPIVWLTSPPRIVQRTLFPVLAGLGRLLGYRAAYARFRDKDGRIAAPERAKA